MRRIFVGIRLAPELVQWVDRMALNEDRTRTAEIRHILLEYKRMTDGRKRK